MGRYLIPGHEYEDGDTITGASMTEHVSEATLKPTTISEQILKDPATLTDELLINDNGVFKKISVAVLRSIIISGAAAVPVGAIMDFAGQEAPDGWLLCYGQEVLRESYEILFETIGVLYGAGNGTTTFQLPDCRGVVVAGRDDMGGTAAGWITDTSLVGHGVTGTTLGSVGGREAHQLTLAELASHAHSVGDYYQTTSIVGSSGVGPLESGDDYALGEVAASTAHPTAQNGGNVRHNNLQPTIILNKIIRYL